MGGVSTNNGRLSGVFASRASCIYCMYLIGFLCVFVPNVVLSTFYQYVKTFTDSNVVYAVAFASLATGQSILPPFIGWWSTARGAKEVLLVCWSVCTAANRMSARRTAAAATHATYSRGCSFDTLSGCAVRFCGAAAVLLRCCCDAAVWYALSDSVTGLILSRFVIGACTALAVPRAFLAKVTSVSERSAVLSTFSSTLALGFVFGPLVSTACVSSDFEFGGRRITEYNIGGLISALVSAAAVIILTLFFVNDPPAQPIDERTEPLLPSPTGAVAAAATAATAAPPTAPVGIPSPPPQAESNADPRAAIMSSYASLTGSSNSNSIIVTAVPVTVRPPTELQTRGGGDSAGGDRSSDAASRTGMSPPATATAAPAAPANTLPPLDTSISVFCLLAYAVVSGQALGQFETIAIPLAISDYGFTALENGFLMAGFGAVMFVTLQLISLFLKQRAAATAAAAAAAASTAAAATSDYAPVSKPPPAAGRTSSSYDRSFIFVGKCVLFGSALLLIRWPPNGWGARSHVAACVLIWCVYAVGSTLAWGMYIPLFSKIVGARPQGAFMGFLGMAGHVGRIVQSIVVGLALDAGAVNISFAVLLCTLAAVLFAFRIVRDRLAPFEEIKHTFASAAPSASLRLNH